MNKDSDADTDAGITDTWQYSVAHKVKERGTHERNRLKTSIGRKID